MNKTIKTIIISSIAIIITLLLAINMMPKPAPVEESNKLIIPTTQLDYTTINRANQVLFYKTFVAVNRYADYGLVCDDYETINQAAQYTIDQFYKSEEELKAEYPEFSEGVQKLITELSVQANNPHLSAYSNYLRLKNEEKNTYISSHNRLGLSKFEVEGENGQKYYRTVLLSCNPAQFEGVYRMGDQAFRYHFNLEQAPEGTIIVDSHNKDITNESFGISKDKDKFYIYVPVEAKPNNFFITIETDSFCKADPLFQLEGDHYTVENTTNCVNSKLSMNIVYQK